MPRRPPTPKPKARPDPPRAAKASAPKRRTQAERRETTRRELIEATIKSFSDVGFTNTTVATIAERCSMSRGALFSHFPTLFDLTTAAVEEMFARLRHHVIDYASRTENRSPSAALPELWRIYKSPEMQILQQALAEAAVSPELAARLVPALEAHEKATLMAARAWFPEAAKNPSFDALCTALLCFFQGASLLRLVDTSGTRERELFELMTGLADLGVALAPPRGSNDAR